MFNVQVVAISKMKPRKKQRTPSEAGKYNYLKKKNGMETVLPKRTIRLSVGPNQFTIPPNDGEHFSANWKILQEVSLVEHMP